MTVEPLTRLSVESFCREAALTSLAFDPERIEGRLEEILETLCSFGGFDQLLIAHFPEETGQQEAPGANLSHYWPREDLGGLRSEFRSYVAQRSNWLLERLRKAELVTVADAAQEEADGECFRKILRDSRVSACIVVPLLSHKRPVGLLLAASNSVRPTFSDEERLLLTHMGELFSVIAGPRRRLSASRIEALERVVGDTGATFRDVVESLPGGVIICDGDGFVSYMNAAAEQMTGYGWEEVRGKRVYEFFFTKDGPDYIEQKEKHHRRYQARLHGESEEYEALVTRRDGAQRWFHTKAAPIRDVRGEIVGDVTERKLLEAQLLWSQKMDAVGRLAGSVAHDFNNLLTVIGGYANIVLKRLPDDDTNRKRVAAICDASETACSLTQQLLTLSQRQVVQPTVVSLNQLLEQNADVLRGLVGETCSIEFDLAFSLPAVKADIGQLQQIFINLVVNAGESMEHGGTITVRTSVQSMATEEMVGGRLLRPGSYVVLEVQDCGSGISDAVRERLFEPFYSTKREGNGLGLSTVYGIVTQHGGGVTVDSTLQQGSTFREVWPAVDERPQALRDPTHVEEMSGTEQILLVEDEEAARQMMCEVLETKGYSVVVACDGQEALDVLKSMSSRSLVDMILTDVVMPNVNGFELAEYVAKEFSQTKLLMISGCTQDSTIPENIVKKGFPFLAKPFTPEQLLRKVRDVLDKSSTVHQA